MGEIVNLRRARKRRERDQAAREADANRARAGRTGTEKQRDALDAERREAILDGARIERDPLDGPANTDPDPAETGTERPPNRS